MKNNNLITDAIINLCITEEIQQYKPDKIQDGDLYFDGEKIHVIAEDFLGIGEWTGVKNALEIAIKEDGEDVGKVRYNIRTLKDAVWIPTIQQLIDMLEDESSVTILQSLSNSIQEYKIYDETKESFHADLIKYICLEKFGMTFWKGDLIKNGQIIK
ncbi:MAG: hypothetical protein ACQEQF_00560 [Bacillota bacterium]